MMMKQGEWVKRGWLLGVFCGAVVWLALLAAPLPTAVAQDETTVLLTIRLRDSDGRPVTGEVVKLSRLPEETAVACTTDTQGECAWPAAPGLYQLLFDRPLDDITAAILGESGLRGLGVMVGGAPNGGAPNGGAPNGAAPNAQRMRPMGTNPSPTTSPSTATGGSTSTWPRMRRCPCPRYRRPKNPISMRVARPCPTPCPTPHPYR